MIRVLPILLVAGCATVEPDPPRETMTPERARAALLEALERNQFSQAEDVRFDYDKVSFQFTYNRKSRPRTRLFHAQVDKVKVGPSSGYPAIHLDGECLLFWGHADRRYAFMFRDALLALSEEMRSTPDPETAEFARFAEKAKAWRASAEKPEMPDTARTYKALAEDAFKQKNFGDALEAYLTALAKHPMWPEGHYNAALLAAELKDFGRAALHMRRYLALAPEAQDAPASKEKLLLWEHKAGKTP